MHLPCDFIFDRIMALASCKCSGGALCRACSTFIFPERQSVPFRKGITQKGKNLLPMEADSFPFRVGPFRRGKKIDGT